jgi:hypothetical protein
MMVNNAHIHGVCGHLLSKPLCFLVYNSRCLADLAGYQSKVDIILGEDICHIVRLFCSSREGPGSCHSETASSEAKWRRTACLVEESHQPATAAYTHGEGECQTQRYVLLSVPLLAPRVSHT